MSLNVGMFFARNTVGNYEKHNLFSQSTAQKIDEKYDKMQVCTQTHTQSCMQRPIKTSHINTHRYNYRELNVVLKGSHISPVLYCNRKPRPNA